APITLSGKAHPPGSPVSNRALKPARDRKHHPPLKSTQAGVQIRLTLGQIPVTSSPHPAARRSTPTAANRRTFNHGLPGSRSHCPAISPRSMVPSVGMKLSVAYPPPLWVNGCAREKSFRNHTSNAHARLLFLSQWAASPVKCHQSAGTPTAFQSKSEGGSG